MRSIIKTLAIVALAHATAFAAQTPGERTKRVGPEKAVGGLTIEQQILKQQRLHAELIDLMPSRAGDAPVVVAIDDKDRDDLSVPTPMGTGPLRIGVVKELRDPIGKPFGRAFNGGVIQRAADGTFVWGATVTSPDAQAIRLHLTGFALPEHTEMYLLATNGQADGPYVGKGRNGTGEFWTRSVVSDTAELILRYTGPNADVDEAKISFAISAVAHIRGRPPQVEERSHDSWPCSDNASCVEDVNCHNTGPAAAAEDAVAKMEWIQGPFVNTCTGGLLADTDSGSQIPYFLTANHCLSQSNSSVETFFNYTTSSCEGTCPDGLVTGGTPPPANTVGVTLVATNSSSDYTLLTLDQAPPAGAVFLGWNSSPIAFSSGAQLHRISNANFGPQVYSQHSVDTGAGTCSGVPRGDWIYSTDTLGATMGGSSGSPVVNSSGEVVGQLTGCCGFNCGNVCDSASNSTIDGAFAAYFAAVEQFLDPQGGGCTGDAECDDGQFCTGAETCVSGSCQSSGDPCGAGTVCNETTDTCDATACDNNGSCDPGEDCNNCPNDCRQKTNGSPSSRYCCDGDLPNCGDSRCSENGWSCGGGGSCSSDPECDDGQFCNGAETCSGGSCQDGTAPCPQGCDETNDICVSCGGNKAPCSSNSDCCSNNCRNGECKGN